MYHLMSSPFFPVLDREDKEILPPLLKELEATGDVVMAMGISQSPAKLAVQGWGKTGA